jgi:transcriptional regulator with XRE-family HTH domain
MCNSYTWKFIINYICNSNIDDMKERLLEFLKSENKSSAQLAEEIGVQPSGISHILSGRNNPSLDFVLKMLEKYQFLSTDWLLFGKGAMYKEVKMGSLFDEVNHSDRIPDTEHKHFSQEALNAEEKQAEKGQLNTEPITKDLKRSSAISRIVMFYTDSSFDEYTPRE